MGKDDLKFGEKQPDGSTYAGISKETGEKLFVMGEFEEGLDGRSFDQVKNDLAARGLRLPTMKELPAVMRALNGAAGGEEEPDPTRLYWSGSKVPDQKEIAAVVKAVRPEPGGPS